MTDEASQTTRSSASRPRIRAGAPARHPPRARIRTASRCEHFFTVYKDLEPGESVEGFTWTGRVEAEAEIQAQLRPLQGQQRLLARRLARHILKTSSELLEQGAHRVSKLTDSQSRAVERAQKRPEPDSETSGNVVAA